MIATLAVPVFVLGCFVVVGAMLLFVRQIGETVEHADRLILRGRGRLAGSGWPMGCSRCNTSP